jgi:phosphatidylglycerophosphate synthase
MIDGLIKNVLDPLWERAAWPLVRLGFSPNQVTLTGLVLTGGAAATYLVHRDPLVFGLMLAFAFAFDALDGAVARQRNMRSAWGGYLDAVVDRYQDALTLIAIAWVTQAWLAVIVVLTAVLLIPYAKARTAIETPISNEGWPDLFERLERVIFLCAALIGAGIAMRLGFAGNLFLTVALWIMAALAHFTVIQRALRARDILAAADDAARDQT